MDRPPKPTPDFPLCPSNLGYWQKKINGTIHYFGRWGRVVNGKLTRIQPDGCWQAALEEYQQKREDIWAGRTPRVPSEGLTVKDLCNRFLTAKLQKVNSGEIAARTFAEYRQTTDRLVATFGKERLVDDLASDDFERLRANIAKVWGPVRLGNEVQRVRTLFKYGFESGLIDKPMRFGSEFKKPSKTFYANTGRQTAIGYSRRPNSRPTHVASPQLKAMILLGSTAGSATTTLLLCRGSALT